MFKKNVNIVNLLLCFIVSNSSLKAVTIDVTNLPTWARWSIVLTLPAVLGNFASTFKDQTDHLSPKLIALSCGSSLALFEQIKSLDPHPGSMLLQTLTGATALYLTNKLYESYKEGDDRSQEEKTRSILQNFESIHGKKTRLSGGREMSDYVPYLGIVDRTFMGTFTYYLHAFRLSTTLIDLIKNYAQSRLEVTFGGKVKS